MFSSFLLPSRHSEEKEKPWKLRKLKWNNCFEMPKIRHSFHPRNFVSPKVSDSKVHGGRRVRSERFLQVSNTEFILVCIFSRIRTEYWMAAIFYIHQQTQVILLNFWLVFMDIQLKWSDNSPKNKKPTRFREFNPFWSVSHSNISFYALHAFWF